MLAKVCPTRSIVPLLACYASLTIAFDDIAHPRASFKNCLDCSGFTLTLQYFIFTQIKFHSAHATNQL
ncbi:hypothetical protein HK15_10245 [Acetobacter orientalis]|uniref:Secreted protein n=1 Tax=Acetobacter orientalis TaxID=146474 RepID=A0A252B745_9PROT|nr:hypothetical protein HK15_10245 [Acetobacter orientalis]